MKGSISSKNKVFPNNKNINYYYYLIAVSNGSGELITCYIIDQAYSGRGNLATQTRLYNQVQAQLSRLTLKTHLHYCLAAWGSREVCLKVAENQGWEVS